MRGAESRYSRQIRFAPLGEEGQRRIRAAGVAIVGCGALGSFQAETLARAGIGVVLMQNGCRVLKDSKSFRQPLRMTELTPSRLAFGGFFGGLFADRRPCVFAPDPVSLLSSNAPPIL